MSARYKFNHKDFVLREEGESALLFDRRTSNFYNLNDVSAEILGLMEEGRSLASALSRVVWHFDVPDSHTLLRDFSELESQLRYGGVVDEDTNFEQRYRNLPNDDYKPIRLEEVDLIARNLPVNQSRIADLGCGNGHYVDLFREKHYCFGIDICSDGFKSSMRNGSFVVADIADLPLRNASCEAILLTGHVLGYLKYDMRQRALEKIYEALAREGKLIFGLWTENAVQNNHEDLIEVRNPKDIPHRLHFFSEAEISDIIDRYDAVEDVLFLSRDGNFGNEYLVYCCRK